MHESAVSLPIPMFRVSSLECAARAERRRAYDSPRQSIKNPSQYTGMSPKF